ncbi:MAG: ATP-dependent DNA helicase RecG [Lachnospiraceae bacterium]|nr:ATP-dependent DNA helicase RecG [Lachnospiraceae bacterium]
MDINELKNISIKNLKGIGDKNGSLFARLNIESVYDLIYYFPRTYKKLPELKNVSQINEGETVAIRLKMADDFYFKKTAKNAVTTVTGFDVYGKVSLAFFRVTYLRSMLKPGTEWVFIGTVKRKGRQYALEMPVIMKVSEYIEGLRHLQSVYSLTKGINSKTISKFVYEALNDYGPFEDSLDEKVLKETGLPSFTNALSDIHFPIDDTYFKNARDRLSFDEFYEFFTKLNILKQQVNKCESAFSFIETAEYSRLITALPYNLTKGQTDCLNDILNDLTFGYVMNRLVQGDVGSGKTIVAFLACVLSYSNGYQSAFMAPTEVLASQHYLKFKELNDRYNLNMNIVFLSGSVSASDKKKIYAELDSGDCNLVVGTHALIQEGVNFNNLALVVTDEQHRFGVLQRDSLYQKGNKPHVLSLSATPIPGTLANVYYTDMQISLIKDKPQNRIPIKTGIRKAAERVDGLRFLYSKVREGQQAIVVCPMIEENEDTDLSNVNDYSEYLKELMPDTVRIGVLHGRMKPYEKTRVMQYFANGDIDILVSTTVIEVGIDVPNATVILIENAERFGLSTLHQLRGRVGRGSKESYCILIDSSPEDVENERLKVMLESDDGFHIADEDLRLRGPGDIVGVRQSGDLNFKIADIYRDKDLFIKAKKYADLKFS